MKNLIRSSNLDAMCQIKFNKLLPFIIEISLLKYLINRKCEFNHVLIYIKFLIDIMNLFPNELRCIRTNSRTFLNPFSQMKS